MSKKQDTKPEELLSASDTVTGQLHGKAMDGFEDDLLSDEGDNISIDKDQQSNSGLQENNSANSDSEHNDKQYEDLNKQIAKLTEELEQSKNKAQENWDHFIRTKADIENFERRARRDVENAHKFASEKFLQAILPVIDSLEMGSDAAKQDGVGINKVLEGMELTLKMFEDTLKKFDVEKLDPVGESFNPEFHQAMSMQETNDAKPNTILAVMQKGYMLNDRLLRPAMVVVSKPASSKNIKENGKIKGTADGDEKMGTNIDQKA